MTINEARLIFEESFKDYTGRRLEYYKLIETTISILLKSGVIYKLAVDKVSISGRECSGSEDPLEYNKYYIEFYYQNNLIFKINVKDIVDMWYAYERR